MLENENEFYESDDEYDDDELQTKLYTIYKICCNDENITELYVGSSQNLEARISKHKSTCNNSNNKQYNCKVYKFIRENGGWDNWNVFEIETLECIKYEAHLKERYWIEILQSTLNKLIPTRTQQEWFDEYYGTHKDQLITYQHKYKIANRDQIAEKRKLKYEANKEHILEKNKKKYKLKREQILETRPKKYKQTKEQILEKQKLRYDANKEQILEKQKLRYETNKEQITCICGATLYKKGIIPHEQTNKHKQFFRTI